MAAVDNSSRVVLSFKGLPDSRTVPLELGNIPIPLFRKNILCFVDDPSRVAMRFVCRAFRDLIHQSTPDKEFSQKAARLGYLLLLKWARDKGCPWSERTCAYAIEGGYLKILEWARNNG